jgi:predicted RNA binding protein YcfA (HicA-like mRNA interferase family)
VGDDDDGGAGGYAAFGGVSIEFNRADEVREAIRQVEADGWYEVKTVGSHRQFKHPMKPGRVTIAGKLSDDLAPGTYNSILKQAGLK